MSPAMYGINVTPTFYPGGYNSLAASGQSKGKERSREADFEAAFAQVVDSLSSTHLESSGIIEVQGGESTAEEIPVKVVDGAQKEGVANDQDLYTR